VPFTLVRSGIYRTEDKFKIQAIQKTKHYPGKANDAKHSKTKLPSLVTFYDTQPVNEVLGIIWFGSINTE